MTISKGVLSHIHWPWCRGQTVKPVWKV